jgi:hypothetical protein
MINKINIYKSFTIIFFSLLFFNQNVFPQSTYNQKNPIELKLSEKSQYSRMPIQFGLELWYPFKTIRDGKLIGIAGCFDINLWNHTIFFKIEPAVLFYTKSELQYNYLTVGGDFKIFDINKKHQLYAGFSLGGAMPSNSQDGVLGGSINLKYLYAVNNYLGLTFGLRALGFLLNQDPEHDFNTFMTIGIQIFH